MARILNLEDLKSIDFDGLDPEQPEGEGQKLIKDKSDYKNYSKSIAVTVGYLLGVEDDYLEQILSDPAGYAVLSAQLQANEAAGLIRHLNHLRSLIMLNFKYISRRIRITAADYAPIDRIETLKEDFDALRKAGMTVTADLVVGAVHDEHMGDDLQRLFPCQDA